MSNTITIAPLALRSSSLLRTLVSPFAMPAPVIGSWPTCAPSLIAPIANDLQDPSVFAGTHTVRLTDVVPATAGRGAHADRKQGSPPRGTSS